MVSWFDRLKMLLGMKVGTETKVEKVEPEPAIIQPTVVQNDVPMVERISEIPVPVPEAQMQVEEPNVQTPVADHTSELEQLKRYAELMKQNRMDSDALNEDLD